MRIPCFASAMVLLVLVAGSASGAVYVVHPDGTGDFPTIQAAINATVDGDVIQLGDGTFTGNGNRDLDYGGRAITVTSMNNDPATTVIDCQGMGRGFYFHTWESAGSVLSGVTVQNGVSAEYGGGVYCDGTSPQIENCRFVENLASYAGGGVCCMFGSLATLRDCLFLNNDSDNNIGHGGGMHCGNESSVELLRCVFVGNHADTRGGGFHCHSFSTAILSECTFYGNSSNAGSGIGVRNFGHVYVSNSIVAFNDVAEGVLCSEYGLATLQCCDLFGNVGGDWVDCVAGQYGVDGNISVDPLFCGASVGDFTLCANSSCAAENNAECGQIGTFGVGCASCGATSTAEMSWGAIKTSFR